jgi:hypothetical protein
MGSHSLYFYHHISLFFSTKLTVSPSSSLSYILFWIKKEKEKKTDYNYMVQERAKSKI